jgi:hypothetical protein
VKIRVKHYDTEVELELPDMGSEMFERRDMVSSVKHQTMYKREERTPSQIAIELVAMAVDAIIDIREGGAE